MKRVGSTTVQSFLFALSVHVLGVGALFVVTPAEPTKASIRPRTKVRLVSRPKPPPVVATVPKPEEKPLVVEAKKKIEAKPKKKIPKAKTKKKSSKKVAIAKKVSPELPSAVKPASDSNQSPSKPTTTPRKFTVSMEATVPGGGGVAVPTSTGGGWAFGAQDGDPEGEKKLAGPAPVPVVEEKPVKVRQASGVTRLPSLIFQPSAVDMKAVYPEAARREGKEANVYLKILVKADGKVEKVRVVRGAGKDFDQAAVSLVNRFRFKPAESDGLPVSVWIPWSYKFRLEG